MESLDVISMKEFIEHIGSAGLLKAMPPNNSTVRHAQRLIGDGVNRSANLGLGSRR
jgi:hypothetical protein